MESNLPAAGDPYEIVLADLLAKRDQIDNAINAIQALRGGPASAPAGAALAGSRQDPVNGEPLEAGIFLGMTIPEAAKKLLTMKRRAMSNQDVVRELKAGGLVLMSADPQNTVGSVLTRRFKDVGDIVRVERGTWGLASWYPGRNFHKEKVVGAAKTSTKSGGAAATDPSTEQPRPGDLDDPFGQE